MTESKPKPHPHANWIKLWADGVPIEYKAGTGRWVDVIQFSTMTMPDVEYRIKPSNEPWKPKVGEKYFVISDTGDIDEIVKSICNISERRSSFGNCFHTRKEAEAAIPRVKAALKGENVNVPTNVDSPEIDGKPLSDGEKALIKALRAVKIARIPEYRTSVLCFPSEDTNTVQVWCSDTPIAFLTSSLGGISKDKAIIAALKQIKAEQEAR